MKTAEELLQDRVEKLFLRKSPVNAHTVLRGAVLRDSVSNPGTSLREETVFISVLRNFNSRSDYNNIRAV